MNNLSERQKAFCREYCTCLNATQAAENAGYSKKTSYSQGSRLLKKVEIQNLLTQIIESELRMRKPEIKLRIISKLIEIGFKDPETKTRDVIKACELLGKHVGIFTDKLNLSGSLYSEHKASFTVVDRNGIPIPPEKTINYDKLSEEEARELYFQKINEINQL